MDYYFAAATKERLTEAFSKPTVPPSFRIQAVPMNVINPVQGRAAQAESVDEEGNVSPATEQAGDPNKWYCHIRIDAELIVPSDIEVVSSDVGISVCGSFL